MHVARNIKNINIFLYIATPKVLLCYNITYFLTEGNKVCYTCSCMAEKHSSYHSEILSQLKDGLGKAEKQKQLSAHCRKVFELLLREEKSMTAYEILDALRDQGLRAPPTVYRALDYLVKKGFVHRIESLNAFAACSHQDCCGGACQFAVCSSCGAVEEICDESVVTAIHGMKQKLLKHVKAATLEVSGICQACSEKDGA